MFFSIQHQDPQCRARVGKLQLSRGTLTTPCFMPVGTNATVKAIFSEDLEAMGIRLILSNTYHLYLRPGIEVIQRAGGLHPFMAWPHNILTDSGGFQIFSLAPFRRLEEGGVSFKSHLDGSSHRLTPELVIDIQQKLGSDLLMPLDVCTPPGISQEEAKEAADFTTGWARRSLERWREKFSPREGRLFGIIQGNFFKELRRISAEEIIAQGFPGYAIGGLSVGEEFAVFQDILGFTAELMPFQSPHYLMGIGTPPYILEAVEQGIDLFDCVFPTRTARNALAFTETGTLSLKKEANKFDFRAIEASCSCRTCRHYSRAYLRHLFKTREILAAMLTTYHNLHFINHFILKIREAIRKNQFLAFKRQYMENYAQEES